MKKFGASLAILLLLGLKTATAQKFDYENIIEETKLAPLRGRPVPYFSAFVDESIKSNIDQEGLKTETELILRRNGIPLVAKVPDRPPWVFLHLRVDAVKSQTGNIYAVRVLLELHEEVSIRRLGENAPTLLATTWKDSTLMLVGGGKLLSLREDCREMIERFCLDYLKANPK